MSGGYFNYDQYKIHEIVEALKLYLEDNRYGFKKRTLNKIEKAIKIGTNFHKMINLLDKTMCGDYSEETFHSLWREEDVDF